jgi:hypothetical protein
MIDTYSDEWRRICEARWVLRECRDIQRYYDGVLKFRGPIGQQMLMRDVMLVRPHIHHFTKKTAADLIAAMKGNHAETV